jgi:hypothetical protein
MIKTQKHTSYGVEMGYGVLCGDAAQSYLQVISSVHGQFDDTLLGGPQPSPQYASKSNKSPVQKSTLLAKVASL